MIVDLREAPEYEIPEADVCIVGAGAAGLTVALGLLGGDRRVVVLEGGGLEYEEHSQELYEGEVLGLYYPPLEETRLRLFGGSTHHWGGWCRPLTPIDFERRPWVPESGWPIGRAMLEPHLARAHEILDLGPVHYDASRFTPHDTTYAAFDPDLFRHYLWRFSPPTNFSEKYRQTFDAAGNVTVCLHANVTEVRLGADGGRVSGLVVKTPADRRLEVSAKAFVLALGGLETPRLLLNSDRQAAGGIGNAKGLVGRYFMEHVHVPAAVILPGEQGRVLNAYRYFDAEGIEMLTCLGLVPERQRALELLHYSTTIEPQNVAGMSDGYEALSELSVKASRGDFETAADDLWALLTDIDGALGGFFDKLQGTRRLGAVVYAKCEQAPNPASRIVLLDEVDRLGLQRIGLDWQLTPLDRRSIRRATELVAQEVGRLAIGRVWLPYWLREGEDDDAWSQKLDVGRHHMGTTRMAADPSHGVVDAECRVHGIANLYIAGSSVFPTVGFANPTLTIVQLALRLAEHLDKRI